MDSGFIKLKDKEKILHLLEKINALKQSILIRKVNLSF